jgi:hypothetical protein
MTKSISTTYTDYSNAFFKLENIVSYILMLFIVLSIIIYNFPNILKTVNSSKNLFELLLIGSFLNFYSTINLFCYLFIFFLILFFKDTLKDFKYLLKNRFTPKEVVIDESKVRFKLRIFLPFYESIFLPRFREHPFVKYLYKSKKVLIGFALVYLFITFASILRYYVEEKYFEMVILFFIYTIRIWVRTISTVIFYIFTKQIGKDLVVVSEDVMFLYVR